MKPHYIVNTDLHEFQKEVLESEIPVLVDFWADWCPPCTALTPVLERFVKSMEGKLKLVKVEVDEGDNMKLAGRYLLRGFPTVLLFSNGDELGRFSGAKQEHWVKNFIQEHLPS